MLMSHAIALFSDFYITTGLSSNAEVRRRNQSVAGDIGIPHTKMYLMLKRVMEAAEQEQKEGRRYRLPERGV